MFHSLNGPLNGDAFPKFMFALLSVYIEHTLLVFSRFMLKPTSILMDYTL